MLRTEISIAVGSDASPVDKALKQYRINPQDVLSRKIVHRSLDARAGRPAVYVYQIDLEVKHEESYAQKLKNRVRIVQPYRYQAPVQGDELLKHRPVIAGFGPAGMAAALYLALKGYRPIVLERGPAIDERKKAVSDYWKTGVLDPEKNVQFGEGGAGAFSDGKLTTRIKDPRVSVILEQLIRAGADPSVAWMNHPHIGTERLCDIDISIRKTIESCGGEVRFNTCLKDIRIFGGKICEAVTETESIPCSVLILAVGHSARDTFRMLDKNGIFMEPKAFAVGVRVEHLQEFINARQYRNIQDYSCLPAAEYHLSHTSSLGRGVYSFCMCPGGYVVASASEKETVVTNGMSYAARDGINANSAILVQTGKGDFGSDLFAGVRYQEKLERLAYQLGGGKAPAQLICDYLYGTGNTLSQVKPTYSHGVQLCDLHGLFSSAVNQSLEEMFRHTEDIFPGFTGGGALMTGVETRSSSPVRISRNFDTWQTEVRGIYPVGEGAGYAGGIMSSAVDGMKAAEKIIGQYQPDYE